MTHFIVLIVYATDVVFLTFSEANFVVLLLSCYHTFTGVSLSVIKFSKRLISVLFGHLMSIASKNEIPHAH